MEHGVPPRAPQVRLCCAPELPDISGKSTFNHKARSSPRPCPRPRVLCFEGTRLWSSRSRGPSLAHPLLPSPGMHGVVGAPRSSPTRPTRGNRLPALGARGFRRPLASLPLPGVLRRLRARPDSSHLHKSLAGPAPPAGRQPATHSTSHHASRPSARLPRAPPPPPSLAPHSRSSGPGPSCPAPEPPAPAARAPRLAASPSHPLSPQTEGAHARTQASSRAGLGPLPRPSPRPRSGQRPGRRGAAARTRGCVCGSRWPRAAGRPLAVPEALPHGPVPSSGAESEAPRAGVGCLPNTLPGSWPQVSALPRQRKGHGPAGHTAWARLLRGSWRGSELPAEARPHMWVHGEVQGHLRSTRPVAKCMPCSPHRRWGPPPHATPCWGPFFSACCHSSPSGGGGKRSCPVPLGQRPCPAVERVKT